MGIDIFAGDNRVIHNDTQYQNEREQTDSVQGQAQFRHNRQPPQETYRDADKHPGGNRTAQKQGQQKQHQYTTLQGAVEQGVQTRFDNGRTITPVIYFDAFGQPGAGLLDIVPHACCQIDSILVANAIHIDQDSGFTIKHRGNRVFLEAVTHRGDIGQTQPGAVRPRQHCDTFEFCALISLPFAANQHLATLRFNGAGSQIQ